MLYHRTKGNSYKQIIFIHSNSQSSETWDLIINNEQLVKNYKLITVDLPGHGQSFRSNEPQKDYSVFGMANSLKKFISEHDNKEYILVGNSFGANLIGEIAMELVNCKGIMLVGSSAVGAKLTISDIFQPNPNAGACFLSDPSDEQIELLIADVGYNLSDKSKKEVEGLLKKTDGNVRTQLGTSITNGEYSDELGKIEASKIPVAIVFGQEDKICYTNSFDKISFPKWKDKIHLIPNSGHFPQLDQPNSLITIIQEFSSDCLK